MHRRDFVQQIATLPLGTGVTVLRHAVDHFGPGYARLRVLNTALEPLHISAGVAELRDHLTVTAA